MIIARPAPLSSSTKHKSVFEPGEVRMIQQQNVEVAKMIQQQAIADAELEESYRNSLYANRASIMEANARSSLTITSKMTTCDDDEDYEYEIFGRPSTKVGKLGHSVVKLKNKLQLRKTEEKDPYAATYDRGNGAEKIASSAIQYLVPVLKHSGPADPRLDDTGVNR